MQNEIILIVDDSEASSQILKEILESMNYQTITAGDGQSGLQIALRLQPDLVFLDMNMPIMGGLETLEELRKANCSTPVVFMTAYGSEQMAVEVFRLGVRDYLCKPFTPEDVKAALDRALQETRLLREREDLTRKLAIAEAVRATAVTLSHYLNNYLTALNGGLQLLAESLQHDGRNRELQQILAESRESSANIEAVMRVLKQFTDIRLAPYGATSRMLDIESAIQQELERMHHRRPGDAWFLPPGPTRPPG